MVYQTRAAHSSAKFRTYPLRNQRYSKEKRPQRYYKPPSITESCDSGVKSQASEISIKICNADDENVVIQLFRNDTREQKQDRKKKKGQSQMTRQSAGGLHRHNQKHNTKNSHSDKHQSHKNKCKCTENTGLLHNLYRRTFGPTIDETLLAGMEALYNTCVPDCEEHGNYKPPQLPEPPKKQPDKLQIDVQKFRRGRYTPEQSKSPDSSSYQTIPDPSNTSVTTPGKSLAASTPEKLHSVKENKEKLTIMREFEIKKESVNSTNANKVSLQEVIEKNTIPQETRFAITRVTKYADFTTYEVLKSTKARPKVIPCVTENIFIVKKKDDHDGTASVHEL